MFKFYHECYTKPFQLKKDWLVLDGDGFSSSEFAKEQNLLQYLSKPVQLVELHRLLAQ